MEASQECIELSVKSILSLFNIKYPPSHGWNQDKRQFAEIAKQICERGLLERIAAYYLDTAVPLPRLLFLMNFWAQFYITAKYGFEAEDLASAKDLIRREEAELAVKHADECYRAVLQVLSLQEDRLSDIIGPYKDANSKKE